MCITFIHNASDVPESDYRLIIASNRDELYDRPTCHLAPWKEDPAVVGGRDLEAGCDGGTWLAICPLRKKIGFLLNLPTTKKTNAKTRGKLVADFVKCDETADEYIEIMKSYAAECNHFNFVAVDLGAKPTVLTYNNLNGDVKSCDETEFGISNSLPDTPLKKVEAGKDKMKEICRQYAKIEEKAALVDKLVELLKSREQHLPDPLLQHRPKEFSSIFVALPEIRYGTRTHTVILITKTGHVDVIEITLQEPVDADDPQWARTEMQFDL
ncbi:hypothetical protein O0L34_g11741 [Tuta absoluta]|nr:hypothetical protein O0L34_g11741 [Tuta absoluta]